MAFTVQDYNDFVRLLAAHPEWRPELRRLVLSDELLDLPRAVQALTEAQRHTDGQLAQLTDRVDQLAEAQRHTDAQLAQLTDRMVQLVEAQQQSEARLAGVEERLARLEASLQELTHQLRVLVLQVQNLAEAQQQTTDRLGRVVGDLLELRYREHAAGYFGRHLRRARAVALVDIEEALEAALSPEELLEALRLDLLVRGRRRDRPDAPEVWLAVEVAAMLNEADVERAGRRAALLRKAGYRAIPVVAGEGVTGGATELLQDAPVVLVLDGRSQGWEEALAKWGEQPSKE